MKDRWVAAGIVAWVVLRGGDGAWAEVELALVSTAPARAHLVAAGTSTSFVLSARNTAAVAAPVTVRIEGVSGAPGEWQALLSVADAVFRPVGAPAAAVTMTIPARETVQVVALLAAGAALPEGAEGAALVRASVEGSAASSVELRGRVRNRAKVYYIAIDGCSRGYLTLDRRGAPFDGRGERLMPRAVAFASRGARMAGASSVLPAVTDPNHAAALTGSWSGTLGIFAVRTHYMGEGPGQRAVMASGSRDLLRFGPDGQRIQSVFDVGKDPAQGGSASTFNAIVTGKNWVGELFRDAAVDLVVHGSDHPGYVPTPAPYRLGDPPSDPDADADREGTNLGPRPIKHFFSTEARLVGVRPDLFPEDRWIAEATVRVIQAEDPDALYVNLADVDAAQHVFGAADRPEEWIDRRTPNVLWDDENVYNPNANRDPVLDVVYEADHDFGIIEDVLAARQMIDRSYVVLLSDHGLNTVMNTASTVLDPGQVLLAGGIAESDVEWIANRGESGFIVMADPGDTAKRDRMEAILESYEVVDPVRGTMVKPLVVINREEMDSGVDVAGGVLVEDRVPGNRHGALYSEWNIGTPSLDNSKVRWPDLFFFTRDHFHTLYSENSLDAISWVGLPFNGDHGASASGDVVLVASGPGIRPGVYPGAASLVDIAPTLYRLLGIAPPPNVDGRILDEILDR